MFIAGVILLILGAIFGVNWLWILGLILVAVGAVLFLLGTAGRQVGPRRHYY
jgi:hypothetical protein